MPGSCATPHHGDVLVSKVTASVQHELSIVPEPRGVVCRNHETAIARARRLAQQRRVDAWLTEDHTHFLRIAAYRAAEDLRPAATGPTAL